MPTELGWDHAITEIPETGLAVERAATLEERRALAHTLELADLPHLSARYALRPAGRGRYVLSGTLSAEVVQTCVITLEPVTNLIEESFDLEFWPAEQMPEPKDGEIDFAGAPEPEPVVAGRIEVGRIVFECLASALDPYPRKPGAVFEYAEPATGGAQSDAKQESPFAVLGKRRRKD
jgi:uncharacterized protein